MKKHKLTKHTFHLSEGQTTALKELHPNLKIAEIIRRVLANYITGKQASVPAERTMEREDISL